MVPGRICVLSEVTERSNRPTIQCSRLHHSKVHRIEPFASLKNLLINTTCLLFMHLLTEVENKVTYIWPLHQKRVRWPRRHPNDPHEGGRWFACRCAPRCQEASSLAGWPQARPRTPRQGASSAPPWYGFRPPSATLSP